MRAPCPWSCLRQLLALFATFTLLSIEGARCWTVGATEQGEPSVEPIAPSFKHARTGDSRKSVRAAHAAPTMDSTAQSANSSTNNNFGVDIKCTLAFAKQAEILCSEHGCCGVLAPRVYAYDSYGHLMNNKSLTEPLPNARHYTIRTGEAPNVSIANDEKLLVMWNPYALEAAPCLGAELVKLVQLSVCKEALQGVTAPGEIWNVDWGVVSSLGATRDQGKMQYINYTLGDIPAGLQLIVPGDGALGMAIQDSIDSEADPASDRITLLDRDGKFAVISDPLLGYEGKYGAYVLPLPDLSLVGTTLMSFLVANEDLLDLSFLIQETILGLKRDVTRDWLQQYYFEYVYGGSYYAVPVLTDYRVVYYNSTTLKTLGLKPPPPVGNWNNSMWQWSEFNDYARKIKNAGLGYGIVIEPNYDEEMKLFSLIGRENGGLLFEIKRNLSSTCGMTNENFQAALEATVMTWIREGLLDPDFYPADNLVFQAWNASWPNVDYLEPPFDSGTIDPNTSFSGFRFSTDSPPPDQPEIGLASMPGSTSFLGGSGVAMTRYVRNITRAWDLILELTNQNGQYLNNINLAAGKIPPYVSAWNKMPWSRPEYDVAKQQLFAGATYYYPFTAPRQLNEVEEAKPCRTALLSMVLKNLSVVEATKTACDTMDYLLLPFCNPTTMMMHVGEECDSATGTKIINFQWTVDKCRGGELPRPITVDCLFYGYESVMAIVYYCLTPLAMMLIFYLTVITWTYREHRAIKSASVTFCLLFLLGNLLIYTTFFVRFGYPYEWRTALVIFLETFGTTLVFASLAVKLYRIYKIFVGNPTLRMQLQLRDRDLMKYFLLILLPQVITSIFMFTLDVPEAKEVPLGVEANGVVAPVYFSYSSWGSYTVACMLLYFYLAVLLFANMVLSWRLRKVPAEYQEALVILVIVYQLFIIVIINVPVAVILKHSQTEKAVLYASIFFATTFNVLVFYAPKYNAVKPITALAKYVKSHSRVHLFAKGSKTTNDTTHSSPDNHSLDKQVIEALKAKGHDDGAYTGTASKDVLEFPSPGQQSASTTQGQLEEAPPEHDDDDSDITIAPYTAL